jgi:hypothetical protein
MMDELYDQVQKGEVVYQKLQLQGIDAHAWLVIGMVKTRDGYTLKIIDSNFPLETIDYVYQKGMTNFMREYIPRYSLFAKPLSREVNTSHGEWPRSDMVTTFEVLKRAVAAQLSLAHLTGGCAM